MDLLWARDEPQLVCTVSQGSEVMGYVVIDSMVGGRSCGGLRMLPDIDETEIRGLARAMTLKYGFLGLPQGGAKAGVRGDPEAPNEERWRRLTAFGQAIAPLLRSHAYVPGTDMGTDIADIQHLLEAAGMRIRRKTLGSSSAGYYTALTVFAGAKQAARHLGLTLSGCSAAIEGFGHVGSELGELLAQASVRVVAISTLRGALYDPQGLNVKRLAEIAHSAGSRVVDLYAGAMRIDRSALLELPVDLLFPCARQNSLHVENALRIRARVICPAANNPVTPEAERMLSGRGVLCLPDFVTGCGGVLGGTMEFASIDLQRIASFVEQHIGERIAWLLDEAARQGTAPREIALPFALHRFEQVRRNAAQPTLAGRLFEAGLGAYRRGWIPGPLVAALSLPYFRRTLA